MYLIVAIDKENGMMFNGRRQSRDRVLCEKVLDITRESRLWVNSYTAKLFEGYEAEQLAVDEDFIGKAGDDEFCFAENVLPSEDTMIKKIILFKWNRQYPGDFFFNIDLAGWSLKGIQNFAGFSHENITMEVYDRENI